jgi:hypothetical protein
MCTISNPIIAAVSGYAVRKVVLLLSFLPSLPFRAPFLFLGSFGSATCDSWALVSIAFRQGTLEGVQTEHRLLHNMRRTSRSVSL